MNRQILARLPNLLQFFQKRILISLRTAQGLLHIPGTCLCTIFIISISPESQPHCFDIEANLLRSDSFCHQNTKTGIVSQAACAVHIKQPVRTGCKAQISVSGMGHIFRRIGKSHFQLSRHFFCLDKGHQIFSCFSGPWHYIKIFPGLCSGKGRAHHVPRIISAAAHGNNSRIKSLFHNAENLFLIQIVKLNGLTGRKMHFLYLILLNHSGGKC